MRNLSKIKGIYVKSNIDKDSKGKDNEDKYVKAKKHGGHHANNEKGFGKDYPKKDMGTPKHPSNVAKDDLKLMPTIQPHVCNLNGGKNP